MITVDKKNGGKAIICFTKEDADTALIWCAGTECRVLEADTIELGWLDDYLGKFAPDYNGNIVIVPNISWTQK